MEVIGPSLALVPYGALSKSLPSVAPVPPSLSIDCLYPHPGDTLGSFAALLEKTHAWVSPPETLTQSVAGPRHRPGFSAPRVRPECGGLAAQSVVLGEAVASQMQTQRLQL